MQKHSNPKNQEGFKQIIHTQKKTGKKNNNTHTHTKKELFKSDLNHTPLVF